MLNNIEKEYQPDMIIAFSAGASAAWRLSENNLNKCKRIISFYPSQIRNHININPHISIKVIFPHQEKKFNVNDLNKEILLKMNVESEIMTFDHGFMNKSSLSYSKEAEILSYELIKNEINKINM